MERNVLTVRETADYLGFSATKVYKLIEAKRIPASKIGGQYRFLKNVINAWLARNIISEDVEFSGLIKEVRKDFLDAGYTQKDIDENIKKFRKNSTDSN